MKLLLTSGGATNPSIRTALVGLLGKPIEESHALVIPTAQWGHPMCGPRSVRNLIAAGPTSLPFTGLGWASLGVLELTSTTEGAPSVIVPVLSSTATVTSFAVWIASALRMMSPFREAAPVPVISAIGVARPSAQGHAITMVVMKANTPSETGSRTDVTHGRYWAALSRKKE